MKRHGILLRGTGAGRLLGKVGIGCMCVAALMVGRPLPASGGLFEKPSGPIVERTIDRAAQSAIDAWLASLEDAPRFEAVSNVGVLGLVQDNRSFTTLLSDALSRNPRLRVVILKGDAWDAIEEELARQDPDGGWGDIMDKAQIAWDAAREDYALPESTLPANALLMGQVRSVDADNWINPRVQLNLRLITVKTREVVAGGLVEGESFINPRDFVIYYKAEVVVILAILIVLGMFRRFVRGMQRPR